MNGDFFDNGIIKVNVLGSEITKNARRVKFGSVNQAPIVCNS